MARTGGPVDGPYGVIEEMRLRDLGVIADATLPMGAGFTAITGETGAGKTMVVTGLGLLLGARADSSAVRAGASQAAVDGIWNVPETGAVADRVRDAGGELEPIGGGRAELVVARSITAEGRSRASVGGRSAPAAVLADLADELVVMHGQADQLRLRTAAAQRDAVDRFGGARVADALGAYRAAFDRWREIDRELTSLRDDRDARAREAQDLRAALAEIDAVAPQPGEDVELAQRAERLTHAEELRVTVATAHELLSGEDDSPDAAGLIAEARRALERGAAHDDDLQDAAAEAAELGYRVADLTGVLSRYLADLDEAGPHELATVQDRRAALSGLIRAHGSLDDALALADSGAARLAELDDDSGRVVRLEQELDAAASVLDDAAAALTAVRTDAAGRLGAAVTAELHDLAMPDARVVVSVEPAPATAAGRDDVQLMLAAHSGAQPRSVARSASGGELSRVMLAIEVVIAESDPVPTFVFDEVDAGIGGAAAIEVGRRLARLAQTSQVIAVTHLAQVAAFADNHLSVIKQSDGSVTASSVRRLDGAQREAEMARLLSGMSDSDVALSHARELLTLPSSAA